MADRNEVDLLLSGPRGRAVCLAISGLRPVAFSTSLGNPRDEDAVWYADGGDCGFDDAAVDAFAAALAAVPLSGVQIDDEAAVEAVAGSVGEAMYWEEPSADEALLADPRVTAQLRRFAAALVDSPATVWWSESLQRDGQFYVGWLFDQKNKAAPPLLSGAAAARNQWRLHAEREERAARNNRPADPSAPYTGSWWSTPVFAGLVTTTPRLPNGIPAQLIFVEDPMGMGRARVAQLRPAAALRILEITGPADLVDLVAQYPLSMDAARRHDWYRVTGCRGPWLVPDWAAVGEAYDAVHLTVLGYLATAGRAIPVGDHFTMLAAGWEPSETWWLNDVLSQASAPVTWEYHPTRDWGPQA